jgi:transcriptional regulator with XRE-family HTH domain
MNAGSPQNHEADVLTKGDLQYALVRVQEGAFDAVRRLWDRRVAEGMTQKGLAKILGKDQAVISRNLRGPANWTFSTLSKLARGMRAKVQITLVCFEDIEAERVNYDAFDGYAPIQSSYATETATPQDNVISTSLLISQEDVKSFEAVFRDLLMTRRDSSSTYHVWMSGAPSSTGAES